MAEAKAQLNSLRMAPRKMRAVAKLVRGKDADKAMSQLEFMMKRSSPVLKKLLESAVANAENNFNMVRSNLYVKDVIVDEGIKLRRFRPKGFGRVSPIQKKTSHIEIILGERTPGLRGEVKKEHKHEEKHAEKTEEKQIKTAKPKVQEEIKKKGVFGNIGRKFFRRKAI